MSYYDYYQPEAYVPRSDTYIEKEADINEEIEKLRHASTNDLLTKKDVVIVASVSCIYGLGNPDEYRDLKVSLTRGAEYSQRELIRNLVSMQYVRNEIDLQRGTFRFRGDSIEVIPSDEDLVTKIQCKRGRSPTNFAAPMGNGRVDLRTRVCNKDSGNS